MKKTKAQLTEELEQVKLEREIAVHRLQRNLSESLTYSPPYDLIDPFSQMFDGNRLIFPLFPSRWDYRLFNSGIWVSEAQLDLIRMYSRFLYDTNLTAKGVIRSLENYIVKTGYEYVVVPKPGMSDRYAKEAQAILDEFMEGNNWFERELDFFRRSRRDGEFFLRLFPQASGTTEIRVVEPEQVRPPDQSPEWLFGVKVNPDDKEKVLAYYVTYDGNISNGDEVSTDEMVQMKINVDAVIRRGLSDFFCAQESLQAVQKLLRASIMGESVRQAIAYIRQFSQAPQATVQSLQSNNTDYYTPLPTANGIPRLEATHMVVPGEVQDIPEGLQFQDGPKGQGANATAVLAQAYQALSAYWQIPQWMVSGDTGNVNYASSLTAESPFVRNCEKEQKLYSRKFQEIMVKVLHIAEEQGRLPQGACDEVMVSVHCPPVVVRNAKEETERNLLLYQNGLLSQRTWADREELDLETERENKVHDNDPAPMMQPVGSESTTPGAEYAREVNRP